MSLLLFQIVPRHRTPWGAAASLAAHLALGLLVVWLSSVRPLDQTVPPPSSISVELVPPLALPVPAPELSAPALALAETTAPAIAAAGSPTLPAASADATASPERMTKATKFYATSFLKDPANAKLKRTLSTFADSEKLVQLCNMEGIEQIRMANPKYDPDVLVSYALSDFSVDGLTLIADGGAFHSGLSWTAIKLRCTVAFDYSGVTDFEFAIGKPIPKSDWAAHNLPDQYEDSE